MIIHRFLAAAFASLALCGTLSADEMKVAPPTEATVKEFQLPAFYKQCVLLEGFPVVASEKVSPVALREAAYLVQQMLRKRPDVLRELAKNKVRLAVMGRNEYTCDVPEHSKLRPAGYWNRRARGLGPSPDAPAVSCGEENLLCLKGDHYSTENILIHEFAHAIHLMGLNTLDTKFDQRLREMYDSAIRAGLFVGTYAGSNHAEYFAEAVQSWFDTNRENDREHNHVNTREELKKYDPALAGMMAEIFGDDEWRYVRPEQRKEPRHFAGFDREKEAPFAWPEPMVKWYRTNLESDGPTTEDIDRLELAKDKPSLPAGPEKQTTLLIVNRCKGPVRIAWVPPEGNPRPMGSVRPGMFEIQDTWRGHVWQFTREDGSVIGYTACLDRDGRVVVSELAGGESGKEAKIVPRPFKGMKSLQAAEQGYKFLSKLDEKAKFPDANNWEKNKLSRYISSGNLGHAITIYGILDDARQEEVLRMAQQIMNEGDFGRVYIEFLDSERFTDQENGWTVRSGEKTLRSSILVKEETKAAE